MLRNMDNLDLSSFQVSAWTNLKVMDLTGNNFFFLYTIVRLFDTGNSKVFFLKKKLFFRFSKRV